MKPHPDMTVEDIFVDLQAQMGKETLPEGVGYVATHQEQAEAKAALMRALADAATKMRTLCVGCGTDVALIEAALCACGGFVCHACQQIEEAGVCDHDVFEPPAA